MWSYIENTHMKLILFLPFFSKLPPSHQVLWWSLRNSLAAPSFSCSPPSSAWPLTRCAWAPPAAPPPATPSIAPSVANLPALGRAGGRWYGLGPRGYLRRTWAAGRTCRSGTCWGWSLRCKVHERTMVQLRVKWLMCYLGWFGDLRRDARETGLRNCLLVETTLKKLVEEGRVVLMLELWSAAEKQGTGRTVMP